MLGIPMPNRAGVRMSEKATIKAAKAKKVNRGSKSNGKGQNSPKPPKASQNPSGSDRKACGKARKFKLSPDQLNELKASAGKEFPNPYRLGSTYHAVVAALAKLGSGNIHPFEEIVRAVELPTGFKSRKKRNGETGLG